MLLPSQMSKSGAAEHVRRRNEARERHDQTNPSSTSSPLAVMQAVVERPRHVEEARVGAETEAAAVPVDSAATWTCDFRLRLSQSLALAASFQQRQRAHT